MHMKNPVHMFDPGSNELMLAEGGTHRPPCRLRRPSEIGHLVTLVRVWATSSGYISPSDEVAVIDNG